MFLQKISAKDLFLTSRVLVLVLDKKIETPTISLFSTPPGINHFNSLRWGYPKYERDGFIPTILLSPDPDKEKGEFKKKSFRVVDF